MRRSWISTLIFVIFVYFLILGGVVWLYVDSKPQLTGVLSFKKLQGKVSITRDQYGIVHIDASKSDLDAFFALGYSHAQDRFWQMEFNRRVAQGTLSEIFGSKTIKTDEYLRTWGFYRSAAASWPFLSAHTKAVIQSYTDGVNAYIAQQHFPLQFKLLGLHPKPWTVYDTLSWQKVLAWDLQDAWKIKFNHYLVKKYSGKNKIPVFFPPYPSTGPVILSNADLKQSNLYNNNINNTAIQQELNLAGSKDKGSNNWVVSGKFTASGKPLLADDPHLELQSPSLWYLAEIKAPGLDVMGATMPGMPGVVIGHNQSIAWGVTNVNPDVQDLYILSQSQIKNIHTQQEIIKVRDNPNVLLNVQTFHQMPIISNITAAGQISPYVALKWTAFDPDDTTVQSILNINYAQNWTEFTAALKDFVTPSQNFVYADIHGNIGYYLPGKLPVRHWNSDLPVPYDKAHQWSGYIPFDQLPHVYNPPEGLIATANNLPVGSHYQYAADFRWNVPPFRIERILKLLQPSKSLKPELLNIKDFERIQLDNFSTLWQALSPVLLKTVPLDKNSKTGLDILKNWNGNTDIHSIGSTVFAYWYRELDGLMPDYLRQVSKYPEPLFIAHQFNHPTPFLNNFLSQSLETAMQKLILKQGDNPQNWEWGSTHQAVFRELGLGSLPVLGLFWNRYIPTPGSLYTINAGTYYPGNFEQNNGAAYRQIVDLSDLNHSLFIITLGQSNDPLSPNYEDQLKLWRDGKYLSMSTNPKDWQHKKILTLKPD